MYKAERIFDRRKNENHKKYSVIITLALASALLVTLAPASASTAESLAKVNETSSTANQSIMVASSDLNYQDSGTFYSYRYSQFKVPNQTYATVMCSIRGGSGRVRYKIAKVGGGTYVDTTITTGNNYLTHVTLPAGTYSLELTPSTNEQYAFSTMIYKY